MFYFFIFMVYGSMECDAVYCSLALIHTEVIEAEIADVLTRTLAYKVTDWSICSSSALLHTSLLIIVP
jgi:hypothetical protein